MSVPPASTGFRLATPRVSCAARMTALVGLGYYVDAMMRARRDFMRAYHYLMGYWGLCRRIGAFLHGGDKASSSTKP